MNMIQLGKEVIISDPCYEVPTWCQKVLKNVWPGNYSVFCKKSDVEGWGNRVSMLMAIHEDHLSTPLKWKVEGSRGIIGVDSGQAGIFDMSTYRVNPDGVPLGDGDISFFGSIPDTTDSEKWYTKICSHTLGEQGWGHYSNGVVSRSGLGDGGYDLFVARVNRKVVAMAIDFGVEDSPYVDFGWYRNSTVKTS